MSLLKIQKFFWTQYDYFNLMSLVCCGFVRLKAVAYNF